MMRDTKTGDNAMAKGNSEYPNPFDIVLGLVEPCEVDESCVETAFSEIETAPRKPLGDTSGRIYSMACWRR